MEVFMWIGDNWSLILEGIALLFAFSSLIVGATDTKSDDRALAKVRHALERLSLLQPRNAPGTLKMPFKKAAE